MRGLKLVGHPLVNLDWFLRGRGFVAAEPWGSAPATGEVPSYVPTEYVRWALEAKGQYEMEGAWPWERHVEKMTPEEAESRERRKNKTLETLKRIDTEGLERERAYFAQLDRDDSCP